MRMSDLHQKEKVGTLMKKTLLALTIISNIALAQGIEFGELGYAGKGCLRAPNVNIVKNSKGAKVSIAMLDTVADSRSEDLERVPCTISLPMSLPVGVKAKVTLVRLKGVLDAVRGNASIGAEAFVAGGKGPRVEKSLAGKKQKVDLKNSKAAELSACGSSILRLNSSAIAKGGALANLQSAEIKVELVKDKSCQ